MREALFDKIMIPSKKREGASRLLWYPLALKSEYFNIDVSAMKVYTTCL